MDPKEEIKKLQEEVVQLHTQLKAQQQKLAELYQRLQQLGGQPPKSSTPFYKPAGDQPTSMENFIGLRIIHVIGIVVLVIGLSIGVKYAIDKELISEGARILLAYAAGATLYVLSWRLKKKYAVFSAILFSGAMASLYFTTYAAYVYYALFPFAVAFALMILLTANTVYQAIVYSRQEIALLGLVGAYAIPFLISKNTGRADLFFTYITLINSAVVFLSYKKGWKWVGYLAQIITWVLLIGWAMTQYKSSQRWVGIFFMCLFFLLFTLHALLERVQRHQALAVRDIQMLLLNNVALYIAALILFAPDFSSAQLGAISGVFTIITGVEALLCFYFLPAEAYTKKMLALFSLVMLLVFIANEWDGISVTLLWLITAVGLFAWGFASKAVWLRMSSIVLMGVTLLKLVAFDSLRFTTIQKIIAYITLGILLLVVGFLYQKFKQKLFENHE